MIYGKKKQKLKVLIEKLSKFLDANAFVLHVFFLNKNKEVTYLGLNVPIPPMFIDLS